MKSMIVTRVMCVIVFLGVGHTLPLLSSWKPMGTKFMRFAVWVTQGVVRLEPGGCLLVQDT
jgi:hypothetical protein